MTETLLTQRKVSMKNLARKHPLKWKEAYSMQRAKDYDRFIHIATMNYAGALEAVCQMATRLVKPAHSIMELGVGTGLLTQKILENFPQAQLVGVDGSKEMLEAALSKLNPYQNRLSLKCCPFENYPWHKTKSDSFDLIISAFSLHHMEHGALKNFFSELFRILKPRGQLIIADYTLSFSSRLQYFYEDIWVETRTRQMEQAFQKPLSKEEMWEDHKKTKASEGDNPAPLELLLKHLKKTGFEEVECYWKHFCYSVYGGAKNPSPQARGFCY